ncbi:alpha/beta fold hydrolase [Nitratifractor salsuginis]|uniref:Alpha/beta hydrolase fold protein n=1 Tax=Nitratifractor salsuginis (strain DSM 16511 / JCM 12458 / E9I37-1) TaxID=749222 RepID=E6WZR3_NITSE|nr:alpha/beta hydrolase [Nitratifractor salsuginis]ADV46704.1 alpha/beta hydrolase fold protein [Nitratifractor salsuginis DSM 16511]
MALRQIHYGGHNYELAYTLQNPSAEPTILFLHGWGSNKELMQQAFGKHLQGWRHLYLDLPGFGQSPNDRFLRTSDYAAIVRTFLHELGIEPRAIAGHSFGGKVATLLDPECLVLLSSAGIQVPKPLSVRVKIALFKLLKPLGLSKLRTLFVSEDAKGMNEGMYETFKATVNEDFEAEFAKVHAKALLFWGRADTATPLWTGERIAESIPQATLYPLEGDHYFFLKPDNAKFVAETIERECGKEQNLV